MRLDVWCGGVEVCLDLSRFGRCGSPVPSLAVSVMMSFGILPVFLRFTVSRVLWGSLS